MTEEMGLLQTFHENSQWRRRRDVQRQSVPQSGSSDRKSLISRWLVGYLRITSKGRDTRG